MPSLEDYGNDKPIKMLLIGDSGMGKTGALACLTEHYKLRILDYDNGLDPLFQFTKPEFRKNVEYVTLTDKMKQVANKIVPVGTPTAFTQGLNLLNHWKYKLEGKDYDYGRPQDWGNDTILVIDSLSHICLAAMRRHLALVGRSGDQPWQSDWGDAMRQVEDLLALLYSDAISCHLIVMAHITYIGKEEETSKGNTIVVDEKAYPNALGKKLPPKVGQYFNIILQADKQGIGSAAKRVIRTVPQGDIVVKNPIPGLSATLSIETGLADFFKAHSQGKDK